MSYIDDIVYENPAFASSYIAGKTYENRNLKTVVLKTNTSTRGIFMDCGMHSVLFLLLHLNSEFLLIVCFNIKKERMDFDFCMHMDN